MSVIPGTELLSPALNNSALVLPKQLLGTWYELKSMADFQEARKRLPLGTGFSKNKNHFKLILDLETSRIER